MLVFDHSESKEMSELEERIAENNGKVWLPTFLVGDNEYFFLVSDFVCMSEDKAIATALIVDEILPMIHMVADLKPTGRAVPMYDESLRGEDDMDEDPVHFFPVVVGNTNAGLVSGPLFEEVKKSQKAKLN